MKFFGKDTITILADYILATLFLLITLYPLYFVVIASFSSADAVVRGKVILFPWELTLAGYRTMLEHTEIWSGYFYAILYTFVGTAVNLFCTIPAAYALSRRTLPFRRGINVYFMITMFLGGGLVPVYLLINRLHLVNTFAIMVLLGAVSVYNMIVCRTFFSSNISEDLIDAAKIDGSSEMGIFIRIVLPLSKAILAVMVLYFAVGHWNDYRTALIYLRDTGKWPLQMVLRNLLLSAQMEIAQGNDVTAVQQLLDIQSMKYGVIIAASLPVLVMYPFIQKYFVKGVMIGAVKG